MFRAPTTFNLFRGMFRKNPSKQRSVPDRGLHQPFEAGTDAFDPKYLRSKQISKQIGALKAEYREKGRSFRAKELSQLSPRDQQRHDNNNNNEDDYYNDSNNNNNLHARATALDYYETPQTSQEQNYVASQFARSMQLNSSRDYDYDNNSNNNNKSQQQQQQQHQEEDQYRQGYYENQDQQEGRQQQQQTTKRRKLPLGLNRPTGPEAIVKERRTMEDNENLPYTTHMHRSQLRNDVRRLNASYNFAQKPSAQEYSSALRKLSKDEAVEEEVDQLQEKLIEDSGMYPTQRLDAYMLRDDSVFPDWVNDLPTHLRDRVRYGGIGLTEDDDILRQNLARMPIDERQQEWTRLKAAREYKQESSERNISPAELRQLRLGIRRHHALHHKRLRRATLLKQLALRRPEKFETFPSRDVDYSSRLSQVAKFVEAGVPTMGEWPLDNRKLNAAKRRQSIAAEAEKEYVKAGVSTGTANPEDQGLNSRINRGIREVLSKIEEKQREVKRISRKRYSQRFTAVRYGFQDEHGRKYHKMKEWSKQARSKAYANEDEMRMDREKIPTIYPNDSRGANKSHHRLYEAESHLSEERRSSGVPPL